MENTILYGMGTWVDGHYLWLKENFNIIGVFDKNPDKAGKAEELGWRFLTTDDLKNMTYDAILISSSFEEEITSYLRDELHLSCEIISGNKYYASYEKEKYQESIVHHLGNEHPDQTFVIMSGGVGSKNRGLFAAFNHFLYAIMQTRDKGYIPVIDMKNNVTIYHESLLDVGKINAWEKFFLQPDEYSIEDAECSKNVIYSLVTYGERYWHEQFRVKVLKDKDFRHKLHSTYKENIVLSAELRKELETQYKLLFSHVQEKDKVLGVSIRGTDYTAGKPYFHPIQPSIEQICEKITYAISEWGITKIYVNSDEEKSIDYIKEKFPEMAFSMDYQRYDTYDKTKDVVLGEMHFKRKDDAYRKGADYLVSTLLFTYCDCFIGGFMNSSLTAMIANDGFEYSYIFDDLGLYGIDDDAYICTPDGKPIYIKKYLIWGTGRMALERYELMKSIPKLNNIKIVGFIDNNSKKWGKKIDGIPIIAPSEIAQVSYDHICILSTWKDEIYRQLEELCIPLERVNDFFYSYFVKCLNEKYATVQNDEIKEIIENMKQQEALEVYYFQKSKQKQMYEAFYDENADLYYILFENKRMYYKRNYPFTMEDGKKYVGDPWYEQNPNSPHLYEHGKISVCDGDVIVDAGTCEGNFSLHNIDKAGKVFLIECDPDWQEALKYTFAPYQDKVVICDKFLSDTDSDKTITLDTLLRGEKISFIKMDIEGEEINALHGADAILKGNKGLKLAICSYHRQGDEDNIKDILHSYHMETETSKGYMLFLYDKDIFRNPELRRGIVRAVSD